MIFTREDILKIQNALLLLSRKDSEFEDANTPLNSEDYISILQDGINKKVSINNLLSTLGLLKKDDFINVSDRYDEYYIQLSEAVTIIANNKRKKGLVITFQDLKGDWKVYQFKGVLNQWNQLDLWEDLFDWGRFVIDSILPDEEDLTKSLPDENGNSHLSLKDRAHGDGMGYIILRKNKSFAEQVTKENTIYEIRYDFILNENIVIPANCILKFNGGSISGEYILTGNNTGILAGLIKIFNTDITLAGSWNVAEAYPEWFGAIGDGEKDCTESFKSLFNTFDSVYIPEGVYNVSDTLYIKGNTSIRGTEKSIITPIKNVNLFLVNRNCDLQNFRVNIPIIYSCNVFSITSEIIDREGPLYNLSLNTVFKNIKIHYETNSAAAITEPLGTSFHFEAGRYSNEAINTGWWGVIVENCVSTGRYGYFMKCFSPQSGYITKVIVNNCFLDGAMYAFFMAPDESKIGDLEYKERTTLNINTVTSESYSFSKRFAYITGHCFIHDCLPFDWIVKEAPYLLLNTTFSDKCIISPIYGSVYRNFEFTNYKNTSNLTFIGKLSSVINTTNSISSSNLSYYNTLKEVTDGDNYGYKRTIEAIRYEHTINKNKYIFISFPIQEGTDDLRLVINTLISTRTSFYMYRFAIDIVNMRFITANDIDYGVRGYYGKSNDNTKVYIAFEFLEDTNNVCIATNFYFLGYSILQNYDIKATIQILDSIPDGFTKYNIKNETIKKGNHSERPILQSKDSSFQYYDTELKKYIVWNGTEWTNMDGTALG